jgi:hypothetical protein
LLKETDGNNKPLPYLADHYFRDNYPIIKQQLIAGGIRLGTLLNAIFKKKHTNLISISESINGNGNGNGNGSGSDLNSLLKSYRSLF